MEQMNKKIAKAIEESLPKQVGEALQKRLADLEETEKVYKTLKEVHDGTLKQLKEVQEECRVWCTLELDADTIKHQREVLDLAQLKFKIEKELKDQKVTSSNEKVDLLNNLVGLLMKNPQAITTMTGNTTHLHREEYNSMSNQHEKVLTDSLENRTITTENTKPE